VSTGGLGNSPPWTLTDNCNLMELLSLHARPHCRRTDSVSRHLHLLKGPQWFWCISQVRDRPCLHRMHTQYSVPIKETFNITLPDICWLLGDYWQCNKSRKQPPWLWPPTGKNSSLTSQCHYETSRKWPLMNEPKREVWICKHWVTRTRCRSPLASPAPPGRWQVAELAVLSGDRPTVPSF
jgi:hypothetical protein